MHGLADTAKYSIHTPNDILTIYSCTHVTHIRHARTCTHHCMDAHVRCVRWCKRTERLSVIPSITDNAYVHARTVKIQTDRCLVKAISFCCARQFMQGPLHEFRRTACKTRNEWLRLEHVMARGHACIMYFILATCSELTI